MKYSRFLSSVILAGAIFSGGIFASALDLSAADIEIVAVEEVTESQAEQDAKALPPQAESFASQTAVSQSKGTIAENGRTTGETETTNKIGTHEAGIEIKDNTETVIEAGTENSMETSAEAGTENSTEASTETETEMNTEKKAAASVPAQGLYEIASAVDEDFVLDVRHCTVQNIDSREVQLFRSLNVNQQKFYLEALPDGGFRVSVLHTGDALTALPDDHAVAMAAMEHPEDSAASESQTWIIEEARHGCCCIRTEDGQYLTLDPYRPCAGVSVVLSDYTGAVSQMWRFNRTWISSESCADTDLVNPYDKDGPFANLRLSLLFGTKAETITAEELSAHIAENEEHQLVLDPSFLDSFVAQLAAKYDTQGQPKRFRTSYGNEITLYEGDFGWKLDTDGTKALLQENLETNQVKTLDPVWTHKGRSLDGDDAIGDSYIEVDLKNQKVFLYKDGKKLLETDCVSGTLGDPERDTPGGVYSIYYMNSPDVLDGPGYSEHVTYWMPFYRGYGLHDATWRSEFGGEIYKTNGSHGCVNLPLFAAERIYKTVDIGYPVVLYK